MSDWEKAGTGGEFPLRRDVAWDAGIEKSKPKTDGGGEELRPSEGEPPEGLFGVDHFRHRDRRILSLIDIPLWDKAYWVGTLFSWPLGTDYPPLLALMFKDKEAARVIFEGLRKELGEGDSKKRLKRLKVSIITGVDRQHPAHYCVVIGEHLKREENATGVPQVVTVFRIKRMEPSDSTNLDNFLDQFNHAGKYFIAPVFMSGTSAAPQVLPGLYIGKEDLRVCPAWQLGEHDPDSCALDVDAEPVIPDGVTDAPVVRTLQRIRESPRRR